MDRGFQNACKQRVVRILKSMLKYKIKSANLYWGIIREFWGNKSTFISLELKANYQVSR